MPPAAQINDTRQERATSPRNRKFGFLAPLVGGAILCVFLAACGSTHPTAAPAKSTASTVKNVSATATTVPGATKVPFNYYNNAHLDITQNRPCTHAPEGSWVLKGTVINPAPAPTGFSIVVDFVHEPGSTVLDTQIVNVPPVVPKHTVSWTASWKYSGGSVSCVVRQAEVTGATS
jgi:hypothetical protein